MKRKPPRKNQIEDMLAALLKRDQTLRDTMNEIIKIARPLPTHEQLQAMKNGQRAEIATMTQVLRDHLKMMHENAHATMRRMEEINERIALMEWRFRSWPNTPLRNREPKQEEENAFSFDRMNFSNGA